LRFKTRPRLPTMSGGRVVQVTKTMFQVESEARWRMWALFGLLLFMVTVCLSVCV
jgi:hypothetical protein